MKLASRMSLFVLSLSVSFVVGCDSGSAPAPTPAKPETTEAAKSEGSGDAAKPAETEGAKPAETPPPAGAGGSTTGGSTAVPGN